MSGTVTYIFAPIEKMAEFTGRPLPELKLWVSTAQDRGDFPVRTNPVRLRANRKPVEFYAVKPFLKWHRDLTLRCGLPLPQPLTAA